MERLGRATWPVKPRDSGRALREQPRYNGATGKSDIEGKVARKAMSEWSRGDASDIDGQTDRSNGAFGKSDIEGKTARESASEMGSERVSNGREHMSQFQSKQLR
jgi:hypothetical protein